MRINRTWLIGGILLVALVLGAQTQISAPEPMNVQQIGGASTSTAASGVQKVGVVGNVGAIFDQATGSVVPANALYVGGNGSGNLTGIVVCDSNAFLDMTTATTTQIVALTAAQIIRVCSYDIQSEGTSSVQFKYGTGTNCGTGTTQLTSNPGFTAGGGISRGSGLGVLFAPPAGDALCVTSSAAVNVHVDVSYTKF